jgi:hypothetical protein
MQYCVHKSLHRHLALTTVGYSIYRDFWWRIMSSAMCCSVKWQRRSFLEAKQTVTFEAARTTIMSINTFQSTWHLIRKT